MRALTVLILVPCIFLGCSAADWLRRNTIHAVYEVDRDKSTQDLIRQAENRPTTKIILNNKSSIISRVVMNYRDVAAVDRYSSQLIDKQFNLEFDVLPKEKVEIIVPCMIHVKVTVHNDIYKKKQQQTINTGTVFFSTKIDATPPGAMDSWRSEDKKCMLSFWNESGHIGEVKVENLGGFTEHDIDVNRTENEKSVNIRRKILTLPEKPYTASILPGLSEVVHLKNGIYRVSLTGNKFKKKLFVQVSDGRSYDKVGNSLTPVFEIPRQPGDPNPGTIPVNVPKE